MGDFDCTYWLLIGSVMLVAHLGSVHKQGSQLREKFGNEQADHCSSFKCRLRKIPLGSQGRGCALLTVALFGHSYETG